MKAEQRHKLETNVLADWIGQMFKKCERYSRLITWGLVLIVVALVAAIVVPKLWARASATAWEEFYTAMATDNLADLERIAEEYPATPVADWGLVLAADARLAGACMQLFSDKVSAAQELRKAIEDYTTVIDQSREPQLRERALYGRARAFEAISATREGAGEIPKAIADYKSVVEGWPNGPYAPTANAQLKRLNSADTRQFYDKFAAYTPKRPVSKEPEGLGKQLPFDASSVPDGAGESEFSKLLNLSDLKVKGASKGEPAKSEPLTTEPSKTETPKAEPPKSDMPPTPPKTDAAKSAPPKTDLPKTEPPKTAPAPAPGSKPEAPKLEPPKK